MASTAKSAQDVNEVGIHAMPFYDLLNVFTYDSEHKYFHTDSGLFCKVWRFAGVPEDSMSLQDRYGVSNAIGSVLNLYPEGSAGQLIRITHKNILGIVSEYMDDSLTDLSPSNQSVHREIVASVVQRQLDGATKGFFSNISKENIEAASKTFMEGMSDEDLRESSSHAVERNTHTGRYAMNSDLYLVFMLEPSWMHKRMVSKGVRKIFASFGVGTESMFKNHYKPAYEKDRARFMKAAKLIEQQLVTTGFATEVVTGQGIVDLLYRELNPQRSLKIDAPTFIPDHTVREAVMFDPEEYKETGIARYSTFSDAEVSPEGWKIGGTYYRACSVKLLPQNTKPGMIYDALKKIEGESVATINFSVGSQQKIRNRLMLRRSANATKMAGGVFDNQLFQPDMVQVQREHDDLEMVNNVTNPEDVYARQIVVDTTIHVVVKDKDPEEADEKAEELARFMWNSGVCEKTIGANVVHQALPMNFNPKSNLMIQREVPCLSSNLADLVPAFVGYQGVGSRGVLVNNSQGQPVTIDVFGSQTTAPHFMVMGPTGTGKSFLVNQLVMQYSGKYQPKIFFIDKGRSYESFCRASGGSYIEMVLDAEDGLDPTCLNPFYIAEDKTGMRGEPTNRELEFMRSIVISMIMSGSGVEVSLNKAEYTLLYEALQDTFNKVPSSREVTLSDYVKVLSAKSDSGKHLASQLYDFTKDGPYGNVFDGPLGVDWAADFIVFETERMADSEAMPTAMLVLFFQIETYIKAKLPRDRKKFMIVDEAWRTLANPQAASQIAGFYRELRKYFCSVGLVSQSLKDIQSLVSAETGDGNASGGKSGILENTRHFFLLSAGSTEKEISRKLLGLHEPEIETWGNCSSLPPFYSEVFYRQILTDDSSYSGVFRLYSNPIGLWMATTTPQDIDLRKNLTNKYYESTGDAALARVLAVRELAKRYPYGSRYK